MHDKFHMMKIKRHELLNYKNTKERIFFTFRYLELLNEIKMNILKSNLVISTTPST